ncbi:MAG: cell division protein FtsL, partial [Lysobacteraceae bacterium]
ATWAETNRIEQVATGKLGMVYPASKDIVVVRP